MSGTTHAPRSGREQDTRAAEARPTWKPLDQYPLPVASGLRFRWILTMIQGQPDTRNVAKRFREGWVPVRAADYPELMMRSDTGSPWPEGIEVSGLLLCQIAQPVVDSRDEYYRKVSNQQMDSVDNSMFKVNDRGDHGMHILRPKRRSRVTVGKKAEADPEAAEE